MKKRTVKCIISLGSYVLLLAYCFLHKYLPPWPIFDFHIMLVVLLITSLIGLYCTKDL